VYVVEQTAQSIFEFKVNLYKHNSYNTIQIHHF